MGLVEALSDDSKKDAVIGDVVKLVDEEVASKGGLSGIGLKAGYAAVKGVKPGFVQSVVKKLLPDFAAQLDPIWTDGLKDGKPVAFMEREKSRVADALLSVTDGHIDKAESDLVKGTYKKLRGSAKKHVEDAVPRLARVVERYSSAS
jgi:hypothetical protein